MKKIFIFILIVILTSCGVDNISSPTSITTSTSTSDVNTVTLSFNTDSNSKFEDIKYEIGEIVERPLINPIKDGKVFSYWGDYLGNAIFFPFIIETDIILYAYYVDSSINGFVYQYNSLLDSYMIVNHSEELDSSITISKEYNGRLVSSIEANAFTNSNLTRVVIPDTLIEVKPLAFYNSLMLEAIHVDNNNKYLESDLGVLYTKNLKKLLHYPASRPGETFNLSNGTNIIDDYSFAYNKYLKQVNIFITDNLVTLNSIGEYAFFRSNNLEYIHLTSNIRDIGKYAFYGCGRLTILSHTDENLLTWDLEFDYLDSNFTVPIIYHVNSNLLRNDDYLYVLNNYDIDTDSITIVKYVGSESDVVIPDYIDDKKVIELGATSFINTYIISITLSNNIRYIGYKAFYFHQSLSSVVLNEGLLEISSFAFSSITSLLKLHLPSTTKKIADTALSHNYLKEISIEYTNTYFKVLDYTLYNYDLTELLVFPAKHSTLSPTILDTVLTIESYAFSNTNANVIYFSDSVRIIKSNAFCDSPNLRYITLSISVEVIEEYAFNNLPNLTLTIPNNANISFDDNWYSNLKEDPIFS